jgi:hypothetical protein
MTRPKHMNTTTNTNTDAVALRNWLTLLQCPDAKRRLTFI